MKSVGEHSTRIFFHSIYLLPPGASIQKESAAGPVPGSKGKALGAQERSPANPKGDWRDRGNPPGDEVSRCRGRPDRRSGQVQARFRQSQVLKLPWRLPTPKCQQRQAAIPSFSRFANGFELLISQLVNTVWSGFSVYSFFPSSSPLPRLLVFTSSSLVRWWMVCWFCLLHLQLSILSSVPSLLHIAHFHHLGCPVLPTISIPSFVGPILSQ